VGKTTLLSEPSSLLGSHHESGAVACDDAKVADVCARLVDAVDDSAVWDRWSALEAAGVATAFQSRVFVEPLIRRLVPAFGCRGFVVEVSDRSGPILAAAFTQRRRRGATIVELADCGLSDYAAPIFRPRGGGFDPSRIAAVERAVLAALPPHDALFLRKMPERIGGHANPFASFAGSQSMHTGTLTVDPVDVLAASSGAMKEAQRKTRRLIRERGRIRQITDRAGALAALDALFAFRAARAANGGSKDPLSHPLVRDFYREVIGDGVSTGFAVVHEIAAADRLLGVVQGFAYRGRFHGTLMGFAADDPASAAVSPGLVGVVHALASHADTGGRAFDFGAGEQAYKTRFGGVTADYRQVARAITIRGLAPVAVDTARREGRRVLRKHPALAARARRWSGH
jgi:CelD/BcsL family acetyltransferase involved in cellulose biosynthesis